MPQTPINLKEVVNQVAPISFIERLLDPANTYTGDEKFYVEGHVWPFWNLIDPKAIGVFNPAFVPGQDLQDWQPVAGIDPYNKVIANQGSFLNDANLVELYKAVPTHTNMNTSSWYDVRRETAANIYDTATGWRCVLGNPLVNLSSGIPYSIYSNIDWSYEDNFKYDNPTPRALAKPQQTLTPQIMKDTSNQKFNFKFDNTLDREQSYEIPSVTFAYSETASISNTSSFTGNVSFDCGGLVGKLASLFGIDDIKASLSWTQSNDVSSSQTKSLTLSFPSQKVNVPAGKTYVFGLSYEASIIHQPVAGDLDVSGALDHTLGQVYIKDSYGNVESKTSFSAPANNIFKRAQGVGGNGLLPLNTYAGGDTLSSHGNLSYQNTQNRTYTWTGRELKDPSNQSASLALKKDSGNDNNLFDSEIGHYYAADSSAAEGYIFNGTNNHDIIHMNQSGQTVHTHLGSDIVYGSEHSDTIYLKGRDSVEAFDGNDSLFVIEGTHNIIAGSGNDYVEINLTNGDGFHSIQLGDGDDELVINLVDDIDDDGIRFLVHDFSPEDKVSFESRDDITGQVVGGNFNFYDGDNLIGTFVDYMSVNGDWEADYDLLELSLLNVHQLDHDKANNTSNYFDQIMSLRLLSDQYVDAYSAHSDSEYAEQIEALHSTFFPNVNYNKFSKWYDKNSGQFSSMLDVMNSAIKAFNQPNVPMDNLFPRDSQVNNNSDSLADFIEMFRTDIYSP